MRRMRAAVKVLCIVTAIMLGMLLPSVSSAAAHCATSPQVAMHHAQPSDAMVQHGMDHQDGNHGAKNCCLAVCSPQAGITPAQPSGLPAAVLRDLVFLDRSAPLTGHPVSPAFEPPRTLA
ncbi:hypothetical protein [Martelella soudanensis]|uniref:hypothetical protein n=1 Tax=unclassified Martelella TaxID=2629616 RepID=UPI0015E012F5|nr:MULTISPECIES: hypothetical protein [unclassified Martelella]